MESLVLYLLSYEYYCLEDFDLILKFKDFDYFAGKYCLSQLELLQRKQDVKICTLVLSTMLGQHVNTMINI